MTCFGISVVGLGFGKFFLADGFVFSSVFLELFLLVGRHHDDGFRLSRDGVAQAAAVDLGEAQAIFLGRHQQHGVHHFVGVGTAQVDVHARVTAFQAFHEEAIGYHFGGDGFKGGNPSANGVDTASTAHIELAFSLRVHVHQDVALQHAGLQLVGTRHARLLVDGEEGLDGSVLQVGGFEDCHGGSGAQTVVGAQGGAVGFHPTVFDMGLNRVVLEIVYLVGVLLRDHVQMGLQDDTFTVFHARGGRLAHDDVAAVVNESFKAMFLAPLLHEGDDLSFFFRRAWNLCETVEVSPHAIRL